MFNINRVPRKDFFSVLDINLDHKTIFLLVFTSFIVYTVNSQAEFANPEITNYTYRDYSGAPLIPFAFEAEDGAMHFPNGFFVLRFDGENWERLNVNKNTAVEISQLKSDNDGKIFYNGTLDFGFIEETDSNELMLVSLTDLLPEGLTLNEQIYETFIHNDKVIFTSDNRLYVYDGDKIEVIEEPGIHVSYVANGKFYSRIFGKGLCVFDGENYQLLPNGETFANTRVYQILPYDEDTLLLGTADDGFYLYKNGVITQFETEIDETVRGSVYLPGAALPNGDFVINTRDMGAYLIDREGNLLQSYTTDTGLRSNVVRYPYLDSRNILWLCTTSGVSAVDLNSNFKYLKGFGGDSKQAITSISSTLQGDYMTALTDFYKKDKGEDEFKLIRSFDTRVSHISSNNVVLVFDRNTIYRLQDDSLNEVFRFTNPTDRIRHIEISELNEERLFVSVGTNNALILELDSSGQYQIVNSFEMPSIVFEFAEDESDGTIIFSTNEIGQVFKLFPVNSTPPFNYEDSELKIYTEKDGVPQDVTGPFKPFDTLYVVADDGGHYKFDEKAEKFVEVETRWKKYTEFVTGIRFETRDDKGNLVASYGKGVIYAHKTPNDSIIINEEIFRELNPYRIDRGELITSANNEIDGVWFSYPEGWIYYNGDFNNPRLPKFELKLQEIEVGKDSLIYNGLVGSPESFELEPEHANISFSYSSPVFINQGSIQYSTRLMGLDEDNWSKWSRQTTRDYFSLPAGRYTFQVKAKSMTGQETESAEYSFTVGTPWYQTWWAYLLYAIGFALVMLAIIRARTSILRQRQEELEQNVEARTREVQLRMDELATVNSVSKTLTEKIELNELIQKVGDEMKRLFKSDITYLALVDKENNIINFPYQDGDDIAPQEFGHGLTSKIITTGEPLLINKDTDITAEYNKMGIKGTGKSAVSYLGVPIPVEDEIVGVISVQSTGQESRFNEEDKRLLNTIAINVGIALHNAELFEEARDAKARAEDANEAKSAFLSTVSHELRTPLTSVLGFAKIIRKRLEDKVFPKVNVDDQKTKRTMKQVNENLNVVISEGERLTTLINDVLDLAKIESGKMEWNKKPIFIQDAINRAIASTNALIESKDIGFEKNIPSDLPLIQGDEDKLIQVVINLLSNAIKFTDKGSVKIEAYQDKDQVIVEIQDTGVGISEDDKHKVFERFRQAGDTLTDKPKGTGLGLPICREIIEHHGGIIWMNSEPGVGSTFFFSIPTLNQGSEQKPIQLDRIIKSLKKQIKHGSKNGKPNTKPTILVVDDDTPIRSLLRQELGDAGYKIEEAANGKAALDMVRNSKPDLIILDVMMPEINGFDVAAVLKNDPATMDIPIIILSIVQDKERGLKIGVDRYLTKPINTEELFHEVDVLLEQGVSKKKVMVVDDDTTAVKSLSDVLSTRGYKVMESDSTSIMKNATEAQPDIIMLNSVHNDDQEMIKNLKLQKGMENVMFFIYE